MNPALPSSARAKLAALRAALRGFGSAAVAFSGGADSSFLLRIAHEELGGKAVAATVRSCAVPAREVAEATACCRAEGVEHVVLDADLLAVPHFAENPPDRCYHCKKDLFERILAFARRRGLAAVLEGTNRDDDADDRPGRRALRELGIRSPLHDAGFAKAEIRALSREMGLPTADKPAAACLASRFPYGERITAEGLDRVGRAEEWIRTAFPGLGQLRVRSRGGLARIETDPGGIPRLAARSGEIASALASFGFSRAEIDPRGYRTGGWNEPLPAASTAPDPAPPPC